LVVDLSEVEEKEYNNAKGYLVEDLGQVAVIGVVGKIIWETCRECMAMW